MAALHFVGNKFAKTLMVPQPNGVKKLKTNASDKQEEFVRRMSRKGAEAACDEEGKYTCLHRWDHLK